jgi:L-alanine-DL-glutamate epimerase-like enolase superfamily enzyme
MSVTSTERPLSATPAAPGDAASKSLIARVDVRVISYPMHNVGRGHGGQESVDMPGAVTNRTRFAVIIETADGSRGEFVGGNETMLAQARSIARALVGTDALAREKIYADIKRKLRKTDRMGYGAFDNALWDLAGKRYGASVSEMLGGFRTRLKAYASTWSGHADGGLSCPEAYADFAEACAGMGYTAFKFHGFTEGDAALEARVVHTLGRRVGDRMALMIDPGCHLQTWADMLMVGRACDEANFFWLEDPMSDGGLSAFAHRKLRDFIKTPILLGEHVRGLELMADLLIAGGTDFIRADPDFDMGITGTMKIAHLAEALGVDVEIHAPGPAARACMSAIRNTNYYELSLVGPSGGVFTPDCYTCGYSDRLESVGADGCFPVPTGPGLGVTIDWDWIDRHTIDRYAFGTGEH